MRGGEGESSSAPLTVCSTRLQRSLATTNAAESLLSRTRHVKRNVKRWRGGQMMLRWVAAGVLEAVKGFRRLKGCGDMPRLVSALRARDQRLGLGVSEVNVASNLTRAAAEFQQRTGVRRCTDEGHAGASPARPGS